MTKNQEIESTKIVVTTGTVEPQVSECDGYILITQKKNDDGKNELEITGGQNMNPLDIAAAILGLAKQNKDLETVLKADFLKMAGRHIIETGNDLMQTYTNQIVKEERTAAKASEIVQ